MTTPSPFLLTVLCISCYFSACPDWILAWCPVFVLQMAEYRISIYGRKQSEWDQMASWIVNNELYSENVVWLIQVNARIFLWPSRNRSYVFGSCKNVYLYGIWEFCKNLEFLPCNFYLLSAATAVQYIQGNGNSYLISEHSWQYLYTTVWGYH